MSRPPPLSDDWNTPVWSTIRTPLWLARIVFLVGVITVVSALSPEFRDRTSLVTSVVPSVFPAAATTGAAASGLVLILLARALRRGKYRAWVLATALSALTVVLHIVKGLDVEEAVISLVVLVLLATSRDRFTARPDPRSISHLVAVLVVGPIVATFFGFMWLTVDHDGQAPGTTVGMRLVQALAGLVGVEGPVRFIDHGDQVRVGVGLAVLGAAVVLLAVLVGLQPADGPHPLTDEERERLYRLIEKHGNNDSLSYFALRDDRSVVFSPNGRAALTYRVVGATSLAAGDPIGAPDAWGSVIATWLDEARTYGWTPAVLAASEQGAEAFHRAGFDALELGDEAILHTADFTLEGRSMRGVRQAVTRCTRAGLTVTCHRVGELSETDLAEIRERADAWRDGTVERGFSMALGRFTPERDPDGVVALTRDADGRLHGILHFVPWGDCGLSLDLMRRDREGENGIIEQLVSGVMAAAPGMGVSRVSLNFAVFRNVFARGERLGAGPVLRLWRGILLWLSRWWQIESLYRSNAKYRPEWAPRFVCFKVSSDLPRVSIAVLRAEALLVAPPFVQRLERWWRPTGRVDHADVAAALAPARPPVADRTDGTLRE